MFDKIFAFTGTMKRTCGLIVILLQLAVYGRSLDGYSHTHIISSSW